ncbi:hypothetical protein [Clostridium sp. JN-9]|uniref:hypothetical protein n=1 Tax=Clostridium sp. JN-9 TaxID=2507159 RepID=UPI000FFE3091|nr:hypothetical protein [Clostridium sp. JN-9]QAT40810.1 hypothetical protein EQM05_11370 [Clostridium sp. JN-9]
MIKKSILDFIGNIIKSLVGCSYSVALILGTIFIILWIIGWRKGLKASILTLTIYAVIVIFGGLL